MLAVVPVWRRVPLTSSVRPELLRVGHLVGRHEPRPQLLQLLQAATGEEGVVVVGNVGRAVLDPAIRRDQSRLLAAPLTKPNQLHVNPSDV
jgi:hypothetical protein